MNWANMINHIIFSLALPVPESAQTRLYRSWRRQALYAGSSDQNLLALSRASQ
jgi:hypothetical protein